MPEKPSDFKEWVDKQLTKVKDNNVRDAFANFVNEVEPSARNMEIKAMPLPPGKGKQRKDNGWRVIIAREFDGLIKYVAHKVPVKSKEGYPLPFKAGKLTKTNYGHLYDQLVKRNLLADTGKDDFVYYYTGEGEPTNRRLVWKGEKVYLSVLMAILCNGQVPWGQMDAIFDGLNTPSMRVTLNKIKTNKNGGNAFERHCRFLRSFLVES